jgi:hypothetical protein
MAKSDLLTSALPEAGISLVLAAVDDRQALGRGGTVAIDSLGGATARLAPGATAWVHRDALFSMQYSVSPEMGQPAAVTDAAQTWLNGLYGELRPYVSGQAYQNYIDPSLADWPRAYYGSNLPRLRAARRKWDPDATFHFAQAIPRS